MMRARVIAQAFDSETCRTYYAGEVVDIDPNSQLATLSTASGDWVFQFEGHTGRDPNFEKRKDAIKKRLAQIKERQLANA